jgi:hypothetical protein
LNASWHPQWQLMANLHRPADPMALAGEIRRLHGQGLTPMDIATSLRLDIGIVRDALRAPQ